VVSTAHRRSLLDPHPLARGPPPLGPHLVVGGAKGDNMHLRDIHATIRLPTSKGANSSNIGSFLTYVMIMCGV
jgi:hypothetical protein